MCVFDGVFSAGRKAFIKKAIAAAVNAVSLEAGVASDEGEGDADDATVQAALLKALGVKHPKEFVAVDMAKELEDLKLSVCVACPLLGCACLVSLCAGIVPH